VLKATGIRGFPGESASMIVALDSASIRVLECLGLWVEPVVVHFGSASLTTLERATLSCRSIRNTRLNGGSVPNIA
jgi:hypothetical protein